LGLEEFVEPRVRRVVTEHLGVDGHEIRLDTSLADDLAADSLDLLEVALALEQDLGIELTEMEIDRIRTYRDLVRVVLDRYAERPTTLPPNAQPPVVRTRVVPAAPVRTRGLERAVLLTPYMVQAVTEDVLRAGPGAALDVTIDGVRSATLLGEVSAAFGQLRRRGVRVAVHDDTQSIEPRLAAG